ncbi:hypothetical protein Dsin_022164 [Dipteronia sinensis]|uniref:Uncharacterized protein n=1 Tax=Dipteronia sinensis TaxID=43782 RepID=A0AAE0A200_9ROSI|nr:hypothetical protein Dsin_022164 [Dipteronia sinensis]
MRVDGPDPRVKAGRLHQTHPDVGRSSQTHALVAVASSSEPWLIVAFPATSCFTCEPEIRATLIVGFCRSAIVCGSNDSGLRAWVWLCCGRSWIFW